MNKLNLGNGTQGSGDSGLVGGGKINSNFIEVIAALTGQTIWDATTTSAIDLSGLNTTNKSSLVGSINEVMARADLIDDSKASSPFKTWSIDKMLQELVDHDELDAAIAASAYGIKYTWADATERTAQTGMVALEQGVQQDTRTVYSYDGANWVEFYTLDPLNWDSRYYTEVEVDALFNDVVYKSTTQTISGAKTFSSLLTANGGVDIETTTTNATLNFNTSLGNARDFSIYNNGSSLYNKLMTNVGASWVWEAFDGTDVFSISSTGNINVSNDIDLIGNIYVGGVVTTLSNADLNITANGTGEINLLKATNITGTLNVVGSVDISSNAFVDGNLRIGDNTDSHILFKTAALWSYYLQSAGNDWYIDDAQGDKFIELKYNSGGATKSVEFAQLANFASNVTISDTTSAQLFLDSALGNDSVINFKENNVAKGKLGWDTSDNVLSFVAGTGAFSTAQLKVSTSGVDVVGDLDVSGQTVTASNFIGSWGGVANLNSYAKHDTVQSYSKQQYFATNTLTDGATISWNVDDNQVCVVTLAGNRTLSNPTNMKNGGVYTLVVKQDATGNRTLSYGTNYEFGDDGSPTLSTGVNKTDVLSFISDGAKMFFIGIKKGFDNYTPPGA